MNLRELYPARFIAAEDFKGKQRTLTIARVAKEKVGHGGDSEMAVVVYFKEPSKITGEAVQLVLCRTNAEYVSAMFGSETNDWAGHKVTLGPEMVESFGEIVPAIRVQGSPEITAPVKYAPARKGSRIKAKTLVPTATTTTTSAPAPAPVAPAAADGPLTARCRDCGWESVLTPDATAGDVEAMSCDACGGGCEVVA